MVGLAAINGRINERLGADGDEHVNALGALGEEDPPVCVDESYGRDEQRFHER